MGMTPHDTVKRGGSDFRSFCFKWLDLPGLIKIADKEYTRQAVLQHFEKLKFDPARLKLRESCSVRVYFVGEGSGYVDSLCVNTDGIGARDGHPKLLFPNANTKVQLDAAAKWVRKRRAFGQWKFGGRSEAEPLLPGDFVDLGEVPAGKTLSFFIVANGDNAYTPIAELNPDQKAHMVGMAVENTPYVLISFEDMFGQGDADFEDAVFAVEMSRGNVEDLLGRFDPWGKAKRLAKWIFILSVLIGTPVAVVAARRRALRKRWAEHCREAEQLLARKCPSDALTAARKAARNARRRSERERCQELIVSASEACNDLASLVELYDRNPELFAKNEPAALAIGRTQIETEHLDSFGGLRRAWEKRETSAHAWLALDCDAMIKQGRSGDALELLNKSRFSGADDAGRLARVAFLRAEKAPDEAENLAARAAALNPAIADTHMLRAAVLEEHGKFQEAHAVLANALQAIPADPILRDRLAGFYCRMGRFPAALEVLQQGLRPPSTDFVWSRCLFLSRVVSDAAVDWKSLEPPPGELRPLIDFLMVFEPGRFWNGARFNAVEKRHPALTARQEVHWLRTLESLRTGNETEARWLLSFERSARESWHPPLGAALLRIVQYRQTEFFGPFQTEAKGKTAPSAALHPFFAELEQYARNNGAGMPDSLARFLKSDSIFAAVCFAAGWKRAGTCLARNVSIDADTPAWARAFWA